MTSLRHDALAHIPNARTYRVISRRQETAAITTLALARTDGAVLPFIAGQYLTVYFPDLSQTLGKQYSISSPPGGNMLSISVRAVGRFSNRLCSLKRGDTLLASLPDGELYPHTNRITMMLAGGMGVAPFRSILLDALAHEPTRRMVLLYSGKRLDDMPFVDELYAISKRSPAFTITRFITQESTPTAGTIGRRMRIHDIARATLHEPTEYLLSGSLSFVLALKNELVASGVPREDIRLEAHSY